MKQEQEQVKTFRVNLETHQEVISYCKKHSLKINDFVSKLLLKTIRNLNESESRKPKRN